MARVWTRGIWFIGGMPLRIFKWLPNFSYSVESSVVAVWIQFLDFPIHMFNKHSLFSAARIVGKPIKLDEATTDGSRLSMARVCVEINLVKPMDVCYANGNRPKPFWKSEKDGNDGEDLSVGLNRRNVVGKQEVTGPFESDEGEKMLNKSDGGKQVWIKKGEASEQGMVDKKGSESRNSFHVLSTLEEEDMGELEGPSDPTENVMYPGGDGYVDTKIGQSQLGPLGFLNLEVEEQKLDELDAHLAAVLAPAHVDSQTNVLNVEPRMDKGKSVVGFSNRRSYNRLCRSQNKLYSPQIRMCRVQKRQVQFVPSPGRKVPAGGGVPPLQKQSGPVGLAGIQDSGQWGNFSFSAMQDEFEGNEVSKSFMEEDNSDYGEAVDSQRSSSFPLVSNPKGPLLKTSINVPSGVTRMVTRSKSPAKCNRIERRILWDDVSATKPIMDEYWPMGGDFNVIIGSNEHSAGFLAKPGATHEFNNFLMLAGLLDSGFVGDRFTWTNGKVWKWLDRILFPSANGLIQVSENVDQTSKFLPYSTFELDAAVFRFWPSKLQIKLKRLKAHLKWWNAEVFGNIFKNVKKAKEVFELAEKAFDLSPTIENKIHMAKC
ncbi:hypothetical protein ZIOFF_047250 [Zingiber officinale]|uniref:DUF4283 domain-containing protein n=1 Tax=Zingiber officinale TaxID=94328 RepID=A0A8J5FNV7_ZINOF|nr:hypothetical protein ZIOFF_047250 [Zingiber officinale]